MKVIHYPGSGKISPRNSGSIALLLTNCTIELPSAAEFSKAVYLFLPVGDVEATITCHGHDRIDGQKDIVIRGQNIHGIFSLGDRYIADFDVAPAVAEVVAVEPEIQEVTEPQPETAA